MGHRCAGGQYNNIKREAIYPIRTRAFQIAGTPVDVALPNDPGKYVSDFYGEKDASCEPCYSPVWNHLKERMCEKELRVTDQSCAKLVERGILPCNCDARAHSGGFLCATKCDNELQ